MKIRDIAEIGRLRDGAVADEHIPAISTKITVIRVVIVRLVSLEDIVAISTIETITAPYRDDHCPFRHGDGHLRSPAKQAVVTVAAPQERCALILCAVSA
jgi:hypothetical protein